MKQLFLLLFFVASVLGTYAQQVDYNNMKNWDDVCFCSTNNSLHPKTVLSADNNWQLLLAMKNGIPTKKLDSLRIPYTQSQLLLLRSQRLVDRSKGLYKATVPILDKEQTLTLRNQSMQVAKAIYPAIERECKELVAYLSSHSQTASAFPILFSYVLDGMIWRAFEKEKMVDERSGTGVWSGNYWFMTPKRPFQCGTNSITDSGKYTFYFNWSDKADSLMSGFYGADFGALLMPLEKGGSITDKETIDEFSAFGVIGSNGVLNIPIIVESDKNELYVRSTKIIDKLFPAFIAATNIETIKKSYAFKSDSEAVVIFYHEVMWDILNLLMERQVFQLPLIFESPKQATQKDVASLCFITLQE